MAKSTEELAHHEWIGYVQPVGLVVSVPAMLEAQCYVNKNISGDHARFLNCLPRDQHDEIVPEIADFRAFTSRCLGWQEADLKEVPRGVTLSAEMATLEVILPQYQESLRPTHVVPAFKPAEGEPPWQMLVQVLPTDAELDDTSSADSSRHWNAAPQLKFERLLRETQTPIGILCNGKQLRLVYAPRGESSGHATFNVAEMVQVSGRPMFAALHMLLSAERMFSLPDNQRLPAILENSRKYQSTVSTKLAEQVLAALYELMRGFQAANDVRQGELLREALAGDPNHVYSGLLTVLMRLVFVLYAEDRNLMSSDPVYSNNYSLTGLFERLREDRGRFPDTMDQRFGAWSQLLTLFRLVFEGGQHGSFQLPARKGYLFDPDRYPFLEGRSRIRDGGKPTITPRISDGVVYRVLRNLLILDGERLSYRSLDVEQIGSVYETVMGFNLQVAEGKSIAIKPTKSHGAPTTINLDALLATTGADRAKWLKEHADQKLRTADSKLLKEAGTIEELLTSLDKKVHTRATPRVVPTGAIVLQPSDERRRSGSHYTPRSLTESIVRTTLGPVLKRLCDVNAELPAIYEPSTQDKQRYTKSELEARVRQSEKAINHAKLARMVGTPHPSQILDLKICDPAMGSGAFLAEACRQLGDELISAWAAHSLVPTDIPPDEDEVLHARRLVAQRCLYGIDRNPMAVDLAKLSLWLVTLAKNHPFTFLDHSLRHGDSLVGLNRRQIIGFHWEPKKQKVLGEDLIQKRLDRATEARARILNAGEDVPYRDQEQRLALAEEAVDVVRLTGDACISAFFFASKKKLREDRCNELLEHVRDWYTGGLAADKRDPIVAAAASLRADDYPIPPFHWEIEFPEVFSRVNSGFDAQIGNPPFAGKNTLIAGNHREYLDWLKQSHPDSHGNSDLVAHFFRMSFEHARKGGCVGFIATKTIRQGDTRATGLTWICENGGLIYAAVRRRSWPGQASVVVAIVHFAKGTSIAPCVLDGKVVPRITAYLFSRGGNTTPSTLATNKRKGFVGNYVLGLGFTFDDTNQDGATNTLNDMEMLISRNPRNADRIFPYINGSDTLERPDVSHYRYIINFAQMELDEAIHWPDLLSIVEARVKGQRESQNRESRKRFWWRYAEPAPNLYREIASLDRVLVRSLTSVHFPTFAFLPAGMVYDQTLLVFASNTYSFFAVMASRVHEEWTLIEGGSMGETPRYNLRSCFEPFPFPIEIYSTKTDDPLRTAGATYYQARAELMAATGEGLTKIYNRFHSPDDTSKDIERLRGLHEAMDRAVLKAYGWNDLAQLAHCEFLLDHENQDNIESSSNRRKPWRHRWPDDFRDEVLARLLELNEQRHNEEAIAGRLAAEAEKKNQPAKKLAPVATLPGFDSVELTDTDRIGLIALAAWGKRTQVDRLLFSQAMLLWKNSKHRKHLLGQGDAPRRKPASVGSIPQMIGRLINNGWIGSREVEGIQWLWLSDGASPVGRLTAAEKKTVQEIRQVVEKQRQLDEESIDQTEDSIRATKEFVHA